MGKGNFDELDSTRIARRWFFGLAIAAQVVGAIAFVLIAVLLGHYQGGFGWGSDLTKLFNYHPLFMTLGMVLLYGDAILVYRVFYNAKTIRVKILHACLLALALIFASIGLKAVFDSHSRATPPQAHLQSFHSWLGLTTVVLFGCQWVCGFVSFLFPQLSEGIRRAYLPSHKFWGKTIFLLAVAAVCMGASEHGIYQGLYSDQKLANQRRILNVFAIFVIVFAVIVFYLVDHAGFQRPVETEPEHIRLND